MLERRRASPLGQVSKGQRIEDIQDLPEVVPPGHFDALPLTESEALAAYEACQLILAIRAKVTYLGLVASDVLSRPDALSAFRQASERGNIQLTALSRFARKLSLPNGRRTLENLLVSLEVNHLPKKFRLYPNGVVPILKIAGEAGIVKTDFYPSRVASRPPPGQANARIVEFGDLHASSVVGDLAALERVVRSGALPGAAQHLGEPLTLTAALAWGIVILIGAVAVVGTAWSVKSIFSEPDIPEGVQDFLRSPEFRAMTPDQQAAVLSSFKKADGFFEKATGLVTTLIIGAAVVTVGGITIKMLLD